MSNYLRTTAPWIPTTWINKGVGTDAWLTEEGVIAYVRSARMREEEKDLEVTYCHHQLVSFRRKRSNPIVLEAWGGHVEPVDKVITTLGPFSKKPFPVIIKPVELTPTQLGQVLGELPQQAPRKREFITRDRRPKIKSRIVRVPLGGDSCLPREMKGWSVEAIHLVGIERKATEGTWDCGKRNLTLCVKGYVEPLVYGDMELEYLYHIRARHIYLGTKDPTLTGQALFLVRFRKGSNNGNV